MRTAILLLLLMAQLPLTLVAQAIKTQVFEDGTASGTYQYYLDEYGRAVKHGAFQLKDIRKGLTITLTGQLQHGKLHGQWVETGVISITKPNGTRITGNTKQINSYESGSVNGVWSFSNTVNETSPGKPTIKTSINWKCFFKNGNLTGDLVFQEKDPNARGGYLVRKLVIKLNSEGVVIDTMKLYTVNTEKESIVVYWSMGSKGVFEAYSVVDQESNQLLASWKSDKETIVHNNVSTLSFRDTYENDVKYFSRAELHTVIEIISTSGTHIKELRNTAGFLFPSPLLRIIN